MPPTFRRMPKDDAEDPTYEHARKALWMPEHDTEDPGDFRPATMRLIGELQRRVDKLERTVDHLAAIGEAQERTILLLLNGWKPEPQSAEEVAALLAARQRH